MTKNIFRFLAVFSVFCTPFISSIFCSEGNAQEARRTTMLIGDVLKFELPNFDADTGFKEWELFGDKATYISESKIDIKSLKLLLFESTKKPILKATITSPVAFVNPNSKQVESADKIFVVAEDFNLEGRQWHWDGAKKIVKVFNDVKINFPDSASLEKKKSDAKKSSSLKEKTDTKVFSQFASLDHGGKENLFDLQKDVRVISPDMKIECDKLKLASPKSGSGVKKIEVDGNVKIDTEKRKANSDSAIVNPQNSTAVLSGNPQIFDEPSKAILSGDTISLDKVNRSVKASSSKTVRARTILIHTDSKGKGQTIVVSADNILMKDNGGTNTFDFKGKVKILSPDFTAYCDEMLATAKSEADKRAEVVKISGAGNVKFTNEDGVASSDKIEILPQKSEVWLTENASLRDSVRGTVLKSDIIIFMREKNNGVALADRNKKDAFVSLEITEDLAKTPISGSSKNKKATKNRAGKNSPTLVKSKILQFQREGEKLFFTFLKDVSIKSESADVTCNKMEVFATTQKKGSAQIGKIVATDNVKMSQKSYEASAEVATIYPKLDVKDDKTENKISHRFVELSTAANNPGKRPSVTLPSFGNLGLDSSLSTSAGKPTKTVVESDKQSLMVNVNGTDKYFFEGNVSVSGTDMKGSCNKIEVQMKSPKAGAQKEISQIIMVGDVKMSQGLKDVECGRADIYADEEIILLSEDPVVINRQDNTRASGPRILYNKGQRNIVVEGDPSKPSSLPSAESAEKSSRPTVVLPSMERAVKKDSK